jgi:hypothetical protein
VYAQGAKLSRARVRWFKHNDMRSLEDLLKQIEAEERAERCGVHLAVVCACAWVNDNITCGVCVLFLTGKLAAAACKKARMGQRLDIR